MYKNIIFPIVSFLTRKDAELAHRMAIAGMKIAQEIPGVLSYMDWHYGKSEFTNLVTVAGIDFPGRVGLAAGFDKHAEVLLFLGALFDFVEVGTVLPYEQQGNKRPRLFRLPQYGALINRMGFNSEGVATVEERLKHYRPQVNVPVGISLGMHKGRPLELAQHDFIMVLMELYVHGDYFVINISSPNTPGLRDLQNPRYNENLIKAVVAAGVILAKKRKVSPKPIFVKISPDLGDEEIPKVVESIIQGGASGIISTNTTTSRIGVQDPRGDEQGGMSGRLLLRRALATTKRVRELTPGLAVMHSGGISCPKDVERVLNEAGADLVQVYTSFVYQGPQLVHDLRRHVHLCAPYRARISSLAAS